MNVLVIGCGLLGRKIARTMDKMGWDVSVLSNMENDLELLESDFEGVTFRGFPMDIPVLPNPPAPRSVSVRDVTSSITGAKYGIIIICAMRSPGCTVYGSALRLCRPIWISPR